VYSTVYVVQVFYMPIPSLKVFWAPLPTHLPQLHRPRDDGTHAAPESVVCPLSPLPLTPQRRPLVKFLTTQLSPHLVSANQRVEPCDRFSGGCGSVGIDRATQLGGQPQLDLFSQIILIVIEELIRGPLLHFPLVDGPEVSGEPLRGRALDIFGGRGRGSRRARVGLE